MKKTKRTIVDPRGKEVRTEDDLDVRHEVTDERIMTVYLEDMDEKTGKMNFRWKFNPKIVNPLHVWHIAKMIMRATEEDAKVLHLQEMKKRGKIIVVPSLKEMPQA